MVDSNMQALALLRKRIEQGEVDVPLELVKAFAEKLMGAEAEALCNAAYGERTPEGVNPRNGYRLRD